MSARGGSCRSASMHDFEIQADKAARERVAEEGLSPRNAPSPRLVQREPGAQPVLVCISHDPLEAIIYIG
jgi:hypothetical protein